jgi:hypothetical protein
VKCAYRPRGGYRVPLAISPGGAYRLTVAIIGAPSPPPPFVPLAEIVEIVYTDSQIFGGLMKTRTFALLIAALAALTALPLAAVDGYEAQTISIDTKDRNVTLEMNYTEATRNLIVVYTVKNKAFDEGDAFVLMRDQIALFADAHGFKHYDRYSDDIIKYHGNETILTRFIILKN